MTLFYILLPFYVAFCLWLGFRILEKAGFNGWWTLVLMVPVVNVVMIWIFAFAHWPALQDNSRQDL
ncbi:hypothetical protein [Methylosarcina fibrata]|uniref:hypothetical protein n=1 Tax=Methylosarcina fibrata TaxID=105972 RepID=UPI0003641C86|nr:hypothetical protein [Methylosarcina fibrata]